MFLPAMERGRVMTSSTAESEPRRRVHLTLLDEMSLADEESARTHQSDPDTLEVRDDIIAIVHSTMLRLRRPLMAAAAVVGTTLLVAVGRAVLMRVVRRDAV